MLPSVYFGFLLACVVVMASSSIEGATSRCRC